MLTGILTKPVNTNKGQDNIMTLDRDALLADVIDNKDLYFHQLGRWSQVLITYKSSQGEQLNHLEFDPTTGAFPTANFNPSIRARNTWQVQTVMIRDLDDGEVIYYRDELDTAHFDITLDQTIPTLSSVTIASNNANTSIANIGDTITLSFTGSEPLTNVSVAILGKSANISGSGTNWTASYTLVGGESTGVVNFSIDYEDLAGNQGTQTTSTTNETSVTIQYIIPTLDIVTIYSNNANTAIAEVGDTVTLDFTASDQIADISVSILGNNVTASLVSGNQYRAQYTVQGGDAAGVVPFYIDYKDLYNNPATTVTGTTDSSSVTVQYVVPTLDIVTIYSDNTNPATAITGDTVSLDFTASDDITNISVSILGNNVTASSLGGNQYRAQYAVQAGDSNGLINFSIDYEDLYNNTATTVTSTTDASSVTISNDKPELALVNIASNNSRNIRYADVGDTIFLVVRANEQTITFNSTTILGNPVNMVYQGPVGAQYQWQAQYIVQAGDAEDIVPFTIDFENNLGVDGDQVTSTTTGNTVEIINQVFPSFLNLQSDNADNTLSEPQIIGTSIIPENNTTVTMTTPSPVTNVEFRLYNSTKNAVNTSGNTWEATFTHSELQLFFTEGRLYDGVLINYDQIIPWENVNDTFPTTDGSSVYVNTAPDLENDTYSSNNQYDDNYLQTGDILTVNLTTSENVTTPVVTFFGNAATVTGSGTSWTAEYTVQSSDPRTTITGSLELQDSYGTPNRIPIGLSSTIKIVNMVPLPIQGNKLAVTNGEFYVMNQNGILVYDIPSGNISGGPNPGVGNVYRDIAAAGDNTSFIIGAVSASQYTLGNSLPFSLPIDPSVVGTIWDSLGQPVSTTNSNIVMLNNSQSTYTSTMGSSWSAASNLPTTKQWVNVVYGNSMWIAVATDGTVIKSTNGTTWSISATLSSSNITNVKYINNQFIIIREDIIWSSTNGTSWTQRSVTFNSWVDITYGNGKYVIVADGSFSPARGRPIATSTDLINWTNVTLNFDTTFRAVEYNIANNVFLIVGSQANNAEEWTVIGKL